MPKKNVAIFGSTGSIGRQTLEVISSHKEDFQVSCLATKGYLDLFEKQIKQFKPKNICISDDLFDKKRFSSLGARLLTGLDGMQKIATDPSVDIIVMSIVGTPGLKSTIDAIKKGKTIALASKEILVAAGDIVMPLAKKYGAQILPLDSEHSAIFQCLSGKGERPFAPNDIKRIILTASGGPFKYHSKKQLEKVMAKDALKHPTWNMGPKISIDSSTLMNKGLEVIEAHHLFGVPYEKIDVVIHPQSMIHSMVEFVDGSIIAQIGVPDMRTPIQYALTYPQRKANSFGSVDFIKLGKMTFEKPDMDRFPCLKMAYKYGKLGGYLPGIMSAANDSAVELFLAGTIRFYDIPKIIQKTLDKAQDIRKEKLALEKLLTVEKWARAFAKSCL